ncbi:TPA: hypothetical protein ACUKPW_003100 [Escherichia coli]|uniref:hypothetical protein n=1 Tax=Escherichia coli TaxID=562 RepID=UPI00145D1767|nr:hypothetical protein [Escherichia coli]MCB7006764.1 hypothetical protein [Escherichia coli]MCB7034022.1 hypothetical protein [Escherichia coli]MCB7048565.1 hypothetical protein [Escherichia coli]
MMKIIAKAFHRVFSKVSDLPSVIPMNNRRETLLDVVVFPYIDLSEPMKATLFRKYLGDFKRRFTGVNGMVDICAIRDIVELAGINLWGEAAAAYKWLERLHCVSFSDMSADIALMVPHKINMVFAGGNYTYPWNQEQRENRKAHAMKSNATP